jgi:hypothetical protein
MPGWFELGRVGSVWAAGGQRFYAAAAHDCATGASPPLIVTDNGTEFTSKALDAWAFEHHVQLPGRTIGRHHVALQMSQCSRTAAEQLRVEPVFVRVRVGHASRYGQTN